MSKRGLGRGLSALIPTGSQDQGAEPQELGIEEIFPNPDQPRTLIDDDRIEELSDSIGKVGLLQPVIVRPHADGYQIIAGERRWRAAKTAGLQRIPVRVIRTSEGESLELALIENLQREDLNALEEARGYRRLLTQHQMTQAELADKVSKSRVAITNALRLLDLPEEVQEMVFDGRLTAGHARAVLAVPSEEGRQKLAAKVVTDGLSVREAETMARLFATGSGPSGSRPKSPKSFRLVARRLRLLLGTNVRVRLLSKKGKIEIDFHDEDELQRIYELIDGGGAGESAGAS